MAKIVSDLTVLVASPNDRFVSFSELSEVPLVRRPQLIDAIFYLGDYRSGTAVAKLVIHEIHKIDYDPISRSGIIC
jgi:hypothetical protein